jgi:hypothetical protein
LNALIDASRATESSLNDNAADSIGETMATLYFGNDVSHGPLFTNKLFGAPLLLVPPELLLVLLLLSLPHAVTTNARAQSTTTLLPKTFVDMLMRSPYCW